MSDAASKHAAAIEGHSGRQLAGGDRALPLDGVEPVRFDVEDVVDEIGRGRNPDEDGEGGGAASEHGDVEDHAGRGRRAEDEQVLHPLTRSRRVEQRHDDTWLVSGGDEVRGLAGGRRPRWQLLGSRRGAALWDAHGHHRRRPERPCSIQLSWTTVATSTRASDGARSRAPSQVAR